MITTGVGADRIAPAFAGLVEAARRGFASLGGGDQAELLLYGSVATGQAMPGRSDLDLLASGIEEAVLESWATELHRAHPRLVRSVEIARITPAELDGPGDEAHGNRVFLWHYGLPLAGPDRLRRGGPYPGDRAAARGFAGDLSRVLQRWRDRGADPIRVARRTLLAAASLHSVATGTWTTDRETGARGWARTRPALAPDLLAMLSWVEADGRAPSDAAWLLAEGGPVEEIVDDVAEVIGLWR